MLHPLAARGALGPLAEGRGGLTGPLLLTWTQITNCAVIAPNTLTKNAGAFGTGTATAKLAIPSGSNGYIEYTASSAAGFAYVGLSSVPLLGYTTIDFALYAYWPGPTLYVVENNVLYARGTPANGDVLRVGIESGQVVYRQNGIIRHTSVVSPVPPMLVDVTIFSTGNYVAGATIYAANGLVPSGY